MIPVDPSRLEIPFRTLGAAFADYARRHPDKLAIHSIDQGRSIAFAPLRDLVDRTATAMMARGVKRGSRVAILAGECLEKLVLIIGMNGRSKGTAEICYVDCFAGPWGSDDAKLEGTSISLSLKTLAACKEKLASLGVDARMRALFIERDKVAFQRLSA